FDADGTSLALWYCDYFKRDNKSGGAWQDSFVDGNGLLETRHVVFNVADFTKPAPGQPAMLSLDDVQTMLQELGEALNAKLPRVRVAVSEAGCPGRPLGAAALTHHLYRTNL